MAKMLASSLPAGRQKRREASLAKWRALDWSKTNVELAEQMGYRNSSPISRARRLIGAPQSPHRYQRRQWILKQREQSLLAERRGWDWSKQDVELAQQTGFTRERIRQIRKSLAIPKSPHHGRRFQLYRWDLMNFDLPDRTLEKIWRVPRYQVTQYRYRHHLPKAKWTLNRGETKPAGSEERLAFKRAVLAEEKKAARSFAVKPVIRCSSRLG